MNDVIIGWRVGIFLELNIYLLLTEFAVRTVSYRPNFFPFDLLPKRKARGPWIEGEKTSRWHVLIHNLK